MSKEYSLDLRRRVIALIEQGYSGRAAARHLMVSPKFVSDLRRRWEKRGTLKPDKRGKPAGGGKLEACQDFLIARVKAQPDLTMPELAKELLEARGVKAAPAELSRFLRRAGYRHKKKR